ncbi:hypothetical protein [Streptomyces sp. NPDC057623]|uniref:hypothetical protein n=1 Tax=Streptomyces sp. NPDC057623 TaxID=3346187 RepID=UPI00369B7454
MAWVGKKTGDDLYVSTRVPAWAGETRGVVRALGRLGADRTRVEVVPARNHREASGLAPHVNMARGWNRQLDMERARLFYDGSFSAATYRAWLDRWAVGYVVRSASPTDTPRPRHVSYAITGPSGWSRSGRTRTGGSSGYATRYHWCRTPRASCRRPAPTSSSTCRGRAPPSSASPTHHGSAWTAAAA